MLMLEDEDVASPEVGPGFETRWGRMALDTRDDFGDRDLLPWMLFGEGRVVRM